MRAGGWRRAPWSDIATELDIDEKALRVHKQKDFRIRRAYAMGRLQRRKEIDALQQKAAENGNPAMLIWLGKQHMDQQDIRRQEVTGADGGPVATKRVVELSDAQLEAIVRGEETKK